MSQVWIHRMGLWELVVTISFAPCLWAAEKPKAEPLPVKPLAEAVAAEKDDGELKLPELPKLDPLPFADPADASLFVPPIEWYAKASVVDRSRVLNEAKALLAQDWDELTKAKADSVAKRFEELCRKCSDDPRLPYEFGLFLWQVEQPASAIAQFEASAKRNSHFFAAHQAAVWCLLQQGRTSAGIERLQRLVNELAEADKTGLSPLDQRRTAEWLGRVIGYVAHVAEKKPTALELESLQQRIQQKLSADRQQQIAAGTRLSEAYFEKLKTVAEKPEQFIANELRNQDADVRKKLKDVTSQLQNHQDAIRNEHGKLHNQQDRIDAEQKAIRKWQGFADGMGRQATNLQRSSYGKVVVEEVLRNKKSDEAEYKTVRTKLPETLEQREQRLNDIQRARDQQSQANAVISQGRDRLKLDRDDLQKNQRTYQQFVTSLKDDLERLESQKRELSREHEDLSRFANHPEEFQKHIRTITPYAPWDVAAQKKLLDESFHSKIVVPPKK